MTETVITRVALIEEATALEKAGGDWQVRHVLAVLGCHRSSLYRNTWIMSKRIHQPGGYTWRSRDIRLYQANQTGVRRKNA